jgi:primosomal replication protein N
VPVLECLLEHRSTQLEAQVAREVEFEIRALALGSLVKELARIDPGTALAVKGFLAPSRKGSKTLLLHITGFDRLAAAEDATGGTGGGTGEHAAGIGGPG